MAPLIDREMKLRFFFSTSLLLAATALPTAASADESAPEPAPATRVHFEADKGGSLRLWQDGAWNVKCSKSCTFDLPAGYEGWVEVQGGGQRKTVRVDGRGEPISVRYEDRGQTKGGLVGLSILGIVGGVVLIGASAVKGYGYGTDPAPDRARTGPGQEERDAKATASREGWVGFVLLFAGCVAAGVSASMERTKVVIERRPRVGQLPTARIPTWTRPVTAGAAHAATTASLLSLSF